MLQILIAESIQSRSDVKSILTLNFSGETEKVFSHVKGNIPIIHLQHAFANYTESISHFDVLDDFDLSYTIGVLYGLSIRYIGSK